MPHSVMMIMGMYKIIILITMMTMMTTTTMMMMTTRANLFLFSFKVFFGEDDDLLEFQRLPNLDFEHVSL